MEIDKQTKIEIFLKKYVEKDIEYVNNIVEKGAIVVLDTNWFGLSKEDYNSEKVYDYLYLDNNSYSETSDYAVSIDLKKLKYRFI